MLIKRRDGTFRLEVFERFNSDLDLPKHRQKDRDEETENQDGQSRANIRWRNLTIGGTEDSGEENPPKASRKGLWARLFGKKSPAPKTTTWFFKAVFDNLKQLEQFKADSEPLLAEVRQARELGQTAFVERLEASLRIKLWENQLIALGFGKAVSEDDVVRVARATERGLRLDWLRNFTRVIPTEVADVKRRLDEAKVFDNWVVMHWDPEGKATHLTQEEIRERARDPILFGVIEGSRRLYFAADWKDEKCDLTFDDLMARLGEKETGDGETA